MGTNTFNVNPEDAIQSQQDVYDVILTDWGTNVNDRYPMAQDNETAVAFKNPGFPWSPVAVAMGPLSTVDRAFLSWNPIIDREHVSVASANTRVVTPGAPLYFQTPAGEGMLAPGQTLNDGILAGTLYVFPSAGTTGFNVPNPFPDPAGGDWAGLVGSTGLPQNYLKADGTSKVFYQDANPPTKIAGLITPTLHLQFFRRPPTLSPGTERLPLRWFERGLAVPAVETPLVVLPIYGRKHVVVTFASDKGATTWRVATLRAMTFAPFGPTEVTEGTNNALAANASGKIAIDNPCADYLLVYASNAGVAGGEVTVTAVD